MLSYESALQRLPTTADADAVRSALKLLDERGTAIVRRFASNIKRETRLPNWAWQRLFHAILSFGPVAASSIGADNLTKAIRGALASCTNLDPAIKAVPSAIPAGPPIDDLKADAYGRLVTYRTLSKMWRWSSSADTKPRVKPILSTGEVRDFIEDMATTKGLAARRLGPVLSGCALGRYVMWSTFDQQGLGIDPFVPRIAKLPDLVATLGLDAIILFGPPSKKRARLLKEPPTCILLRYTLPASHRPHIPTVVEAYAGSDRMNYYFDVFQGTVSVP